MERHSIDEADAFEMLREHSRRANSKLVDVAAAVVDGHRLLPKQPDLIKPRTSPLAPEDASYTVLGVMRENGTTPA